MGGNHSVVMAVHRVIEARAVSQGQTIAIVGDGLTLSYRELNQRANAVARQLIASGFRRGSVATVRMPRSPMTAVVLLGVLKAGGSFLLLDEEQDADLAWPRGLSFAESVGPDEVRYRTIDVTATLQQQAASSSANLPILSRGSDVACVIPDRDGAPLVLVPHATITALEGKPMPRFAEWSGEAGALDLWMALMNGATVTVPRAALQRAAA